MVVKIEIHAHVCRKRMTAVSLRRVLKRAAALRLLVAMGGVNFRGKIGKKNPAFRADVRLQFDCCLTVA